ncbi:MAG: glycosyltransferase family 2 protein [Bryobacteraceae bacterium]|nr:glycosyltransferase family 2 protein [Bryobacteraceae bacterium]
MNILTPGQDSLLILIPCFNEEGAIGQVVREIQQVLPNVPVLVVDDSSADSTIHVAEHHGASVLPLPHHLGLGGAVQAGYKLAYELGFEFVIRVDGDGQHSAKDIPRVFEVLKQSGVQMVIGSRYKQKRGHYTSPLRGFGIVLFRSFLRLILGRTVYDPTSGFVGVNRQALQVFSRSFPLEYPEIEALVVLQRKRFQFEEVPCDIRPRQAGVSSITALRSISYIVHVLLGVFVNVLRYEGRRRIVESPELAPKTTSPAPVPLAAAIPKARQQETDTGSGTFRTAAVDWRKGS